MSLPAAQQRILDGIAEGLRASEPRLAAMFAIFTRLTGSEAQPRQEQLAARPAVLARLSLGLHRRLPGQRSARGRRTWRRALVLTEVAVAMALVLVLVGAMRPAPGCGRTRPRAPALVTARPACPQQAAPFAVSWRK